MNRYRSKRRSDETHVSTGLYDPALEHDACGVGFVANIDGVKSHTIIRQGMEVLTNLSHRGAAGADPDSGDGGGILMQMPDAFMQKVAKASGIRLGAYGEYGVGVVFLPTDADERRQVVEKIEKTVIAEGQQVLGWRPVPVNPETIGRQARSVQPEIRQLFVGKAPQISRERFEIKLFVIRKLIERYIRQSDLKQKECFYIATLSHKTLAYKGLMVENQIEKFFPDLTDTDMVSALALVHQRFSTNTFPTWSLAQPFRYAAHNGEINTLKGNRNWLRAREADMVSTTFGDDLHKVFPVTWDHLSDSASFDNALEFLVLGGRWLPHAIRMMIPEAWDNNKEMTRDRRDFYEYHASICEPWDGPAAMAFTDGKVIGVTLDRNGLRPVRYVVTKSNFCVMASEVGVLDIPTSEVATKGRISPGKMFYVDTEEKRVVWDKDLKYQLAVRQPYGLWLNDHKVLLNNLPEPPEQPRPLQTHLVQRQKTFGYTVEDTQILMIPMASTGMEPTGSMGSDTPLACLSDRPQPVFAYFKQLFAQVTNPPIDPIREESVMSLVTYVGRQRNLLGETPKHCHQLELRQPILTNRELDKIRDIDDPELAAATISTLYPIDKGPEGLKAALDRICREAAQAIEEGKSILILKDRGSEASLAPIPSLLAVGAVHHYLIRKGLRTRAGLVIETGEAREINHFALLIGFGASAVNPYLALRTVNHLAVNDGLPEEIDPAQAEENYIRAVGKGLKKILSKMGISTIQSYHGAQIFEAIGLDAELIERYFAGTHSRIGGIGLETIHQEVAMRHATAYPGREGGATGLDFGGEYHWRREGQRHLLNPDTIVQLQEAVRNDDYETYRRYAAGVNLQAKRLMTLRGLFAFKEGASIPVDEVEPVSEIVKRFCTGAMSYGSISKEAHETLAIAMNRMGARSNTGEGGEDPERLKDPERRSSIKQVASGRFGVTTEYAVNADELQIKIAQGAKPGEGGQLPGFKVDEIIAKVRHSTPGVTLISPPPHHDIYSIEDLAQLIHDLKNVNPQARISVKLVSEVGVGTVAAGVSKCKSDVVLISGFDGGTGASPLTSIKHAGAPWELGLSETHQVLVMNDLRDRIVVQVDGRMMTGRDVAVGALLGAEEFGFSTMPLIAEGCLMMRKCHLNTCPVGIATQRPELRKKFTGKPEHVVRFFEYVAQELREIMASLGFRTVNEMIGRSDFLIKDPSIRHWKADRLDFSPIFYRPPESDRKPVYKTMEQDHALEKSLDNRLIELSADALENRNPVSASLSIQNTNRTVGAMLSGEVAKRYGSEGLPPDTIQFAFHGSAGQSFGAFLAEGVSFTLCGDANDYLGKAMSGGRIVVQLPSDAEYAAHENVIIGNVSLYGATGGEAYFQGMAGERFCIRNSGCRAVVEGVGDHGCEYMTGGVAVVLGETGSNFAAGMSGGVAFVWDPRKVFERRCNLAMVELETPTDPKWIETLKTMIVQHRRFTASMRADAILNHWDRELNNFVMVMPTEYRRVLESLAEEGEAKHG